MIIAFTGSHIRKDIQSQLILSGYGVEVETAVDAATERLAIVDASVFQQRVRIVLGMDWLSDQRQRQVSAPGSTPPSEGIPLSNRPPGGRPTPRTSRSGSTTLRGAAPSVGRRPTRVSSTARTALAPTTTLARRWIIPTGFPTASKDTLWCATARAEATLHQRARRLHCTPPARDTATLSRFKLRGYSFPSPRARRSRPPCGRWPRTPPARECLHAAAGASERPEPHVVCQRADGPRAGPRPAGTPERPPRTHRPPTLRRPRPS